MLVKDFKLDPNQLTPDARLEDLGLDSLGMADLVFHIEDAFKLSVPDVAVTLTTLGEVVGFIDDLIMARDSAQALPAPSAPPEMLPLSPGQAT
ncbi:phosphopantetheine-binding protein [Polaromonas sp.]|uniref:phosphopantetheine-binding protein n=1 Tax=Polaromonas sp. TaxID=1869339 RepID=UPI0035614ABF